MKKIAVILLSVSLLSGIVFQSCQSTKQSTASKMLKFNFEKGKGYDYEMTTSMNQEMMGQKMEMDMTAYYSMDVTDDNGSEKTISSTFDRMKMNINAGPMKLDVDTDKPIETSGTGSELDKAFGMLNRLFASIKGKKFQMKINAEGKVMEVTGFQEMGQEIVNAMGDEISAEEKQKMMQQFSSQFNDESVKSQFEKMLYFFPNKEVKVGDSWDRNNTITQDGMPMDYNSHFTVTDIEGDMVTLEEKSTIKAAKEGMDMKGTTTGSIVVDSKSGLVATSNQNMKMTVSGQGQSIELNAVTRIKGKAR